MWKAAAGYEVSTNNANTNSTADDDDWDTDADYVNDMTVEEQRYGSKREIGAIDMKQFREDTLNADAQIKEKQMQDGPKSSYGYGGKFGVEKDRWVVIIFYLYNSVNCFLSLKYNSRTVHSRAIYYAIFSVYYFSLIYVRESCIG